MIMARFIIPLLFTLLLTGAYGIVFHKKVEDSLAPVFFIQSIIMLLTAMAFDSLTLGIWVGIAIAVGLVTLKCIFERKATCFLDLYRTNKEGLIILVVLYVFIYVTNYGKVFCAWDEFSHWGMFVKEMFRLDRLFCTSTVSMAHKDYVPIISIFETLWCRLAFRYSEADAYRGIQMLQASMLVPMLTVSQNGKVSVKTILGRGIIFFAIPMFFENAYHTIYQDVIYGVLVFYAMYVVVAFKESFYKVFVLALTLVTLVLSKMTAMAFLPMIVIFYAVWTLLFEKQHVKVKSVIVRAILLVLVPTAIWFAFNKYVDIYVANKGSGQSFDGLLSALLGATMGHKGFTPYQSEITGLFIKALFTEGVLIRIPYLFCVILSVLFLGYITKRIDDSEKKKLKLVSLWIILATFAYAVMMLCLYLTLFSEYEARILASYARYMESMILPVVYLSFLMLILFENEITNRLFGLITIIVIENLVLFVNVKQLVPGALLGERVEYESEANAINSHSDEDASILLIECGSSGESAIRINYLCSPRITKGISPGSKRYEGDAWSTNLSVSDFVELVEQYDMVYLFEIDKIFLEEYGDAFINPEDILNHRLYYTDVHEGKIQIQDAD